MTSFKVNQKSKVVTAYRQSMSTEDYKIIERYNNMGYEVVMLEKTTPKKKVGIKKEEFITYLKGNIDNNLEKVIGRKSPWFPNRRMWFVLKQIL